MYYLAGCKTKSERKKGFKLYGLKNAAQIHEQNVIRKDPNPFPKVLLYCLARWAVKFGKKQGYELCMQGMRMKQPRTSCNLSLKKTFKNALNWKNFSFTKIFKILSLDFFSSYITDESLDIIVYIKKLWKKIVTKIYQTFIFKIFLSHILLIVFLPLWGWNNWDDKILKT